MQGRSDSDVNQDAALLELKEKSIKDNKYMRLQQKLILALINHTQHEVVSIIDSDININTLLTESDPSEFCNFTAKDLHQTLLHIAINLLDLDSVQFLLQQGANPNISNSAGQSTLEVFLATVGAYIEESYKRPNDFSKNRANFIEKAEKILDLLLCFGLDYNKISWSKPFLKKINELKQYFDDIAFEREKHYKNVTEFHTMPELPAFKNKPRFKRTIESCMLKFISWLLEREYKKVEKERKQHAHTDQCVQDFLQSTSQIFETLKVSAEEVKSEKQGFLTKFKTDMDESIKHPRFSPPLIFLIMEYAQIEFAISIKLAETRFKKNNKPNFWITTVSPLEVFDAERYRSILIYAANLQSVLPTFEQGLYRPDTYCSSALFETIAEYVIDDTPKANRLGHSVRPQ